jgi:uncharacterized protein involved in type VI secretion and phage assembly
MSDIDFLELLNIGKGEYADDSKVSTVVVGIVTSNNDEENLGRIKVTFPWHSDDNESDWVRLCTFSAGEDRGSVFIPEVGDEILCAFINGDINRPVCLGSLFGKENTPPLQKPNDKNNIKRIKTRTGHEITFDDEDSKEKLEIKSKSGHSIILDDSKGSEKISIKDKNESNMIEIDSIKNSIKIKCSLTLDIEATNINIKANGMMNIKSNSALKIDGLPIMLN